MKRSGQEIQHPKNRSSRETEQRKERGGNKYSKIFSEAEGHSFPSQRNHQVPRTVSEERHLTVKFQSTGGQKEESKNVQT